MDQPGKVGNPARVELNRENYTVDPKLLPSGNPFECHEEVLSL